MLLILYSFLLYSTVCFAKTDTESLAELQGLFAKFMNSPYYSESELCGGAVTVSFFEVLPLTSNALFTMLHPLLKNVLQTTDHFKISCFRAPFSCVEKLTNHMEQDLDSMADVLMGFHHSIFPSQTEFNSDLTP
jgi:hypothetical protein